MDLTSTKDFPSLAQAQETIQRSETSTRTKKSGKTNWTRMDVDTVETSSRGQGGHRGRRGARCANNDTTTNAASDATHSQDSAPRGRGRRGGRRARGERRGSTVQRNDSTLEQDSAPRGRGRGASGRHRAGRRARGERRESTVRNYFAYSPEVSPASLEQDSARRSSPEAAGHRGGAQGGRRYSTVDHEDLLAYAPVTSPPTSLTLQQAAPLTTVNEIMVAMCKQVDFYFGSGNLPTDGYLKSLLDENGWAPLEVIDKFNRLADLMSKCDFNYDILIDALAKSDTVEVSQDRRIRAKQQRRADNWVWGGDKPRGEANEWDVENGQYVPREPLPV